MIISAFLLLSGLALSKVTDTHDVEYEVWHQIDTANVPIADTKFIQRGEATISKLNGVLDGLYETKAGAYDQLNSKVANSNSIQGEMYRLMFRPKQTHFPVFYASVPKCHVIDGKPDEIIFHADGNAVIHVDYVVGSCSTKQSPSLQPPKNTTVRVLFAEQGPSPKVEYKRAEGAAPLGVTDQPEQTFVQKYWMYILMFFLMMVINGVAPPEQPQQQQPKRK